MKDKEELKSEDELEIFGWGMMDERKRIRRSINQKLDVIGLLHGKHNITAEIVLKELLSELKVSHNRSKAKGDGE